MAYKSQINLGGLGEVPKTTDSGTFVDFTDVYNAIHILAQYTNALLERAQSDGDKGPDKQPWELMTFERWIWLPARQNIKQGEVVTSVYYTRGGTTWNGVYRGAYGLVVKTMQAVFNQAYALGKLNFLCGVALEDAASGELVKFGIGPAIINMSGTKAGDRLYCKPAIQDLNMSSSQNAVSTPGDGQMYLNPPGDVGPWPQIAFSSGEWGTTTIVPNGDAKTGPLIANGTSFQPKRSYDIYMPVAYGVSDNAVMFLGPNMQTDFSIPIRTA